MTTELETTEQTEQQSTVTYKDTLFAQLDAIAANSKLQLDAINKEIDQLTTEARLAELTW